MTIQRSRHLARLPPVIAHDLAHGASDDSGKVCAQTADLLFDAVEAAINFIEAAINFIETAINFFESLLGPRLESQQVLVDAFDLPGQKPKRAFKLADPAL